MKPTQATNIILLLTSLRVFPVFLLNLHHHFYLRLGPTSKIGFYVVSAAAACHVDDETGLLGFKSGIRADPSGMLASWKKGTDCCKWSGVTCLTGDRVTALSLAGQPNNLTTSLTGTISPSLSKLNYLDGLYLQDLKYLGGPFPDSLFTLPKLLFVYIENNKLSGPIPTNIANLVQLEALSLQGNQFSGPIPSSIAELTQLTQLKLGGNLLTGTIPLGIQRLRNLTLLHLERNQLSGPIPDLFSGLSNLRSITLSNNNFTGTIPGSISSLAPKLAYLELGHNSLTGKIPDFLGKFHALDTLDLSWNHFSGTVPKSFANLTKIFNLDLSHNKLVDPFPELHVRAKCGIKMKLDEWKPAETYFYDYIDLSENQITGSPVKLLNRTDYLVGFYASGNKLKFNLESMRFVKSLKHLDLSRNLVYGKVPKAISGLSELNVSYNHLCGQLPLTKFPASAFAGNDCLCGSPLPQCKA
ncbi:hypothetical protein Sango_2196500 [Sesamum angolense]|uniref:Leucine-rich repeat-containing N-terminal plant-type domain-containing protein n=1 Tax=Sesamum angolense TaxID=2727404 RepID=A0AAE1WDL7_9LAMI|nr:hypothetical protein Sango_2196500 [Sesamum angolense]